MNKDEIDELKKDYEKEKGNIKVPFEMIVNQVETFEKGIPFLKLVRPCTIGEGLHVIDEEEDYEELISAFQEAIEEERIIKFVPASGAASRMFKKLQAVLNKFGDVKRYVLEEAISHNDEDSIGVLEFVDNIKWFAFYPDLKFEMADDGYDFEILLNEGNYSQILRYTLDSIGLNYVNQPKGSIKFHNYPDGARTAFEEHLIEAIHYAKAEEKPAKVHFTISPEYRELINSIVKEAIEQHKKAGDNIQVSYSYQKPSTDTIAVTIDNKPFKDAEGNLVFRPAGHGALLENLNDLKGDIILIKNIDNLVTDHLKGTTYLYKKLLTGYLIRTQNKIFTYMRALESEDISLSTINSIKQFAESELSIQFDETSMKRKITNKKMNTIRVPSDLNKKLYSDESFDSLTTDLQIKKLKEKLNRPIRICGMVKNERESGGAPFWVEDEDATVSLQIVEMTQIDLNNEEQKKILEGSTHFNPVDIVCGVRDYKGNPFNLLKYTNPDTGLIAIKSKDGRELKALELPGLWNGSMAKWITVFVKVPMITFNPVKEVNDLLRKEHQPPEKN
ncbi:MAG: DUF4301 family protein [Bacteroidetes bacterium]|nr:DUF4301 family protein [Bacteroidota bacterium]